MSRVRTNNLGYYGSAGVQAEGAYWMNAYEPEWNYGPAFFDARHNFVLSANYELPFGRGPLAARRTRLVGGWSISGIFQARTGFPITVTDGRGSSLQGQRGNERPNCVGDPTPSTRTLDHWLDINAFGRARQRHLGQLRHRRRARAGLQERDRRLSRSAFNVGGSRGAEFRVEAFNLTNTPSFSPPARDINVPNTFGTITSTVSTARTVELVLKFFF